MWGGNFGDDVHLQILKHLWPKGWRLTSSIVYQPVRPCLSLQEVPERLVATLPEDTSCPDLTVMAQVEGRHWSWQHLAALQYRHAIQVRWTPRRK